MEVDPPVHGGIGGSWVRTTEHLGGLELQAGTVWQAEECIQTH